MNKSLWQKAQPHALAIGIFFVISCIYCLPAFKGLVVAQHDATGWQGMAQQSIEFKEKYGHYPLWTGSTFSGMPAFQIIVGPSFNITIAYLHHLFMLFLPEPAGLFFLSCIGCYILCMALGVRSRIAIMASLAYAFASYNAIIVAVGHTTKFSSMGYAPAVLAGLILLTQRKYLLGFIVTLVFSTQLFYQNHVQIVYYTLLVALCMGIVYAIEVIRKKEWLHLAKAGGLAAIAGVMGMLSYAIVLFPTYDYTKETMRGGRSELTSPGDPSNKTKGGLDKDYAFDYSYGITEVLTIAVPRLYGGSSQELQPGSKTAQVFIDRFGMSEEQADQYAMSVMPAYWGPQTFTSGAVYFGAAICVLFIFGVVFASGWQRNWLIAASIMGIVLAWGKHFGALNYFLFDYLPFYNKFRAPSMAMVIPQLTFPILAALGVNRILDGGIDKATLQKKFRRALLISAVFVALLASMYVLLDFKSEHDSLLRERLVNNILQAQAQGQQPSPEAQQQAQEFGRAVTNAVQDDRRSLFTADLGRSIVFMLLAAGLLFFYSRKKISRDFLAWSLIAIVFIDLIGVDLRYLNNKNYIEKDQFSEVFIPTTADQQILRDTSYFRVFNTDGDPFQSSPATSRTSYLHNSVGGYHPAKLALYNDLIREQLAKNNQQVYNMLNTKYFILVNPADRQPVAQLNPEALGPAWFVNGIRYVDNADEEIRALDHFSPRDTVIVDKREQAKVSLPPQPDSTASIRLIGNLNDKISYRSSAAKDGFVVFSEIYYPRGWKAFIDGKETPIARVNYVLRGLSVPAGDHEIEFRFEPRSYAIGLTTSQIVGILSILVLGYGAFTGWKAYRKNKPDQPAAAK